MKLQAYSFEKIREGQKIIEVRLFDEKRREMGLGDTIEFRKEPEQVEVVQKTVIGLFRYPTFRDLVADFPAQAFGFETHESLIEAIYSFYSREQEQQYGVLGIRLKNP